MTLSLQELTTDLARGLKAADTEGHKYESPTGRVYQPGIGPHGEKATLRLALEQMREASPGRYDEAEREIDYPEDGRKSCDLVVPGEWAVEAKLARPFGDKGDII